MSKQNALPSWLHPVPATSVPDTSIDLVLEQRRSYGLEEYVPDSSTAAAADMWTEETLGRHPLWRWLELSGDAVVYHDDLPHRPARPTPVRARSRHDPTRVRHRVGATPRHNHPRSGDRHHRDRSTRCCDCRLGIDCRVPDSVGWPCLRFINTKVSAEQMIPLTSSAAEAIRTQETEVARCTPGSPWLFPAPNANLTGPPVHLRRPTLTNETMAAND